MENVVVAPSPKFWKGRRVFLTGHTGFKGTWTAIWLNSLGSNVFGYSLEPSTQPNIFNAAKVGELVEHQIADVRDYEKMASSLEKSQAEVVIHMAAQPLVRYSYASPMETFETNIMGTAYLLQAIRKVPSVKSVVIITTDKVYENFERPAGYKEAESLGGYDPYSSSKACAEIVTAAMRRSFFNKDSGVTPHGAAVATVRAGNVIGGGDWSMDRLIPDIIRSFQSGKTVQIRNPRSIRPWQHVLEPVSGYLCLAEKLYSEGNKYAEAWNFGPNEEDAKDVEFLVKNIAHLWGGDARWEIDRGPHPHEAHFLRLNTEKVQERVGWKPKWNINQALQETISWYKDYYQSPQSAREITLKQIINYGAV